MTELNRPKLSVQLFGGPILFQGDKEVPLSPFQSYLIALVYGHGPRGISRSKATWLLWEEDDTSRTRHRLSQLVYTISKKVRGRGVVGRKHHRLLPDAEIDRDWLPASDRSLQTTLPEDGAAFLSLLSHHLPTKAFDDWVQAARITQHRRRAHLSTSQGPSASPKAPQDVDSILSKHYTNPLLGREQLLEAVVAQAFPGGSQSTAVVISGEPGIGKSHFLHSVRRALTAHGLAVIPVACPEGERDISHNLLAEIMEHPGILDLVEDLPSPLRAICRLAFPGSLQAPSQAPSFSLSDPILNGRRLHDALEAIFRMAASTSDRVVLLVDDYHWIDAGSAAALSFLWRRLRSDGIALVLTAQPNRIPPRHPAAAFLRTLDGARATWVTLPPLRPKELRLLLGATFGKRLSPDSIHTVTELSLGVPFVALELARDCLNKHGPPGGSLLPPRPSTDRLFRKRRAGLPLRSRHLLRILAVLGRALAPRDLADCAGLDPKDTEEDIARLAEAHLVSHQRCSVLVPHHLVRNAVCSDLDKPTRAIYHHIIAQFLERTAGANDITELCLHFYKAGSAEEAHYYASIAAADAATTGAINHAEQMLEVELDTSRSPPARVKALEDLGRMCQFQKDHRNAIKHFTAARDLARQERNTTTALTCQLGVLRSELELGTRDSELLLVEAEQLSTEAEPHNVRCYLRSLDLRLRAADYAFNYVAATQVLARVDKVQPDGAAGRCLREIIRTRHICYGDPQLALEAATAAVSIASRTDLDELYGLAVKRYLVVLGYRGLLGGVEGRDHVRTAVERFERIGDTGGIFDVLVNFGSWLLDIGRWAEAQEYLNRAGEIVRDLEGSSEYVVFACNMGEALLYQGDYLASRRYYRRAWDACTPKRRTTQWVSAAGLGLCAIETGDLGARAELDGAIPDDPVVFENPTFDPTTVALFRSRWLELRGSPASAATLLHEYATAVKDRMVPAWLKLVLAECRMRRKHALGDIRPLAERGRQMAAELGLRVPQREFGRFLA